MLRILITAGATREPLDPVRYISNRSSGKMGYALVRAAKKRGLFVTLITGHADILPPKTNKIIHIETALEMKRAVMKHICQNDIFVMCAAVADYRAATYSRKKIKHRNKEWILRLIRNPDILKSTISCAPHIYRVGFALETHAPYENAKQKLKSKKLDMIVLNCISKKNKVLGLDVSQAGFLMANGAKEELPMMTKNKLAQILIDRILKNRDTGSLSKI